MRKNNVFAPAGFQVYFVVHFLYKLTRFKDTTSENKRVSLMKLQKGPQCGLITVQKSVVLGRTQTV